ncbi:MAG: 5-deoxy-glucuronate isomerase [bacterium]|nr:5-deoxy-glucuronate isomerase [bacterium]
MSRLAESQYIPAVENPPAHHLVASSANSPLTHLEFALVTLAGGGAPFSWESGDREAVIYLIEGGCVVNVSGSAGTLSGTLGPRASVFDDPPSAVFVPAGSRVDLVGLADGVRLALFSAPPSATRSPRIIGPDQVTVRNVGADAWSRRVTSVADQSVTSRMLVGETHNPPGHWSSYPPHKHDTRRTTGDGRGEAPMEEIYHYLVRPPDGFGLQMVYTPPDAPEPFEKIYRVRHGDTVVIPRGYHPLVAAGGYELVYLWAISGEQVEYAAWADDPAHAWINRPR